MMEGCIECFDARHGNAGLLCKLQWRSKIRLDLHWALGFKIHVHRAIVVLRLCHLLYCCFPVIWRECATLFHGKCKQLIDNAGDERTHTNLVEQLSVIGGLEENTGWVKCNSTVIIY
jgi:hypothetical protein